jgi:hypothetical protein
VKTELGRYLDDTYFPGSRIMARIAMAPFFKTPEEGALTTLYCCLDEVAGQENGLYYRLLLLKLYKLENILSKIEMIYLTLLIVFFWQGPLSLLIT